MITIEDIEIKSLRLIEMGHEVPHYAFISVNAIKNIFSMAGLAKKENYGYSSFSVWTSFGRVHVIGFSSIKDDDVILSTRGNIIIDFLDKVGINEDIVYW